VTDPVQKAEDDATKARARLKQSYAVAKERLHPQTIKEDVLNSARTKLLEKAEGAADALKSRPGLTSTLIAATALVLLRKPIKTLFNRFKTEKDNG
jgi:hypothetical protein